jgi:hypothetical protein
MVSNPLLFHATLSIESNVHFSQRSSQSSSVQVPSRTRRFLDRGTALQSVILLGHKLDDAPLLSDPASIRQLWSSDASTAMIQQYQSEVPDERCDAVCVTDSPHLGFWATSRALVLPPNHNLPPGYMLDITHATLDSFLARISEWSSQPVSDWAWFHNGLTKAWFVAAAHHPKRFAVPMFPLASLAPTLDRWQAEVLDAGVNARHRHFGYAADQFRHRYFRDHLYSHASPTMAAKFLRYEERNGASPPSKPPQACSAGHLTQLLSPTSTTGAVPTCRHGQRPTVLTSSTRILPHQLARKSSPPQRSIIEVMQSLQPSAALKLPVSDAVLPTIRPSVPATAP